MSPEPDKAVAAAYAAALVGDGMRVGLGTGTTVAPLLPVLAARARGLRCVATSVATFERARACGLAVEPFDGLDALAELDIAIDGADQVAPDGWLVKGGGRAHTREKIVAASALRFVVIVTTVKLTDRIRPPVPLELDPFGLASTLRRLGTARLRGGPPSPSGGVIADWTGPVGNPAELAARLDGEPGVIAHGLFPPALVSDVVIARDGAVDHRRTRARD